METKRDEIQALQISYEIAMSIGVSLDLTQMLRVSLRTFLKKLNCVSGGVLQLVEGSDGRYRFQKSYAIPRQPERNETYQAATAVIPDSLDAEQLQQFQAQLPIIAAAENGNYYHIFNLPEFGLLLLVKNKRPLDPDWVLSLKPLNKKLASACNACLAEQAQRAETQYREIFDTLEDGYYETDLAGNVTFFNKGLAQVLGYPEDDLLGISYKVYADPNTQQQIFNAYSEVYRTGQSQSAFLWKHVRKDGSSGFIEASISLKMDSKGKPVGFRGIMRDVTRLVDESLQEEQNRTQTILEAVTTPMLVSRVEDGKLVYVNQPLADMLRLPLADLIGNQTPNFYTSMDDRREVLTRLQEQGYVTNMELPFQRGDGERFWGMITARPFSFDGEPAIIATVVDVTERRQAEESLTKRAKELETVAQVSTAVATVLEPEELLQEVVNLVKERFDLYHTHIFLLDEAGQNLILTSGAGEAGQQMVAAGLSIAVDQEQSLVAQVARTRQGVIVNDVLTEPGFLPNPLLPDTRAEMAVPMIIGNTLLGVLDVQANSLDYFSQEDAEIQTILATQVAIALENARSFAASEEARQQLDELARRLTREGWESYLDSLENDLVFDYSPKKNGAAVEAEDGTETAVSDVEPEALVQPLTIQGEAVGQLKLVEPQMEADEVADIVTAVAASLSAHLENLRLTEQTRAALAQTDALYRGSDQVVRATNIDDILRAVIENTYLSQLDRADIFLFDRPWDDTMPENMRLTAVWEKSGQPSLIPVGADFPVGQFPTINLVSHDTPLIINNIDTDERMDDMMRAFYIQGLGMRSGIVFPLTIGDQWIGIITAQSALTQDFRDEDIRQITSLVDQAATVIQNLRLFEQTQTALTVTESLYNYSQRLNAAADFDEIIQVAAEPSLQDTADRALLFTSDLDETGKPEYSQVIACQGDEAIPVGRRFYLPEFPFARLWLSDPKNAILIGDITTDSRVDENMRAILEPSGTRALAILPLTNRGIWIGLISLAWYDVHEFDETDQQLYNSLATQAASTFHNRLLFKQTDEALSETAALYQASGDINAATTYDDIVNALRHHTILGHNINNLSLNYFDRPWTDNEQPEWVEVVTRWSQLPGSAVMPRYPLSTFPSAEVLLHRDTPTIIEDVVNDSRLDDNLRTLYAERFQAHSTIFVPLVLGNQWVGYINAIYPQKMTFPDQDMRRIIALSRQAAVAIQSIRLLEATEARARREQALREIAAKVRSSADVDVVMRTAVQEVGKALGRRTHIHLKTISGNSE
ncbi:MAG TPA: GAF domain-containing protein [Anaerolineae bacterium]|nr:GAF domain-containing protein [Anaerolineae bacterium]